MPLGAEIYVENKSGRVIIDFLRSLRQQSVVSVEELHYLAPGTGRAGKRRRMMGERVTVILKQGASILENYRGLRSERALPEMLLHGSDQIATTGQARRRDKEGRPAEWPRPPATWDDYAAIWRQRGLENDADRCAAIAAKFGASPSASTLRHKLGSPHMQKEGDQ